MLTSSVSAPPAIGYTRRELSKLLGLSSAQLQSFVADEILMPGIGEDGQPLFTFQDVVLLRAAEGLRRADVPPRRIRSALKGLREQLPSDRSPAGVRIIAYGKEVVVRDGASVWNPESGQALFDFALDDMVEWVEQRGTDARGEDTGESVEPEPASIATMERTDQTDQTGRPRLVPEFSSAMEQASDWYELGCELEASAGGEAEGAYLQALELAPAHADAHLNLGRLLHERGDLAGAERHYRAALDSSPEDATAAFNLGVVLEDLGRDREALDVYQRVMVADPEGADAFFNAARLFERFGDKAGAVRCLKSYRSLSR